MGRQWKGRKGEGFIAVQDTMYNTPPLLRNLQSETEPQAEPKAT